MSARAFAGRDMLGAHLCQGAIGEILLAGELPREGKSRAIVRGPMTFGVTQFQEINPVNGSESCDEQSGTVDVR